MTMRKMLLLLIAGLFSLQIATAANPAPAAKFKPFPADTVQKFIKKYGKDSLVHLLDERIAKAQRYVSLQHINMRDNFVAMETKLYSKHFGLGLDTLDFTSTYTSGLIYKLYGNFYGDEQAHVKNLEQMKSQKLDLMQLFYQNMTSVYGRTGFTTLCKHVDTPAEALDTLYKYRVVLTGGDKIQHYWVFAEYNKNCHDKHPKIDEYQKSFYSELYKTYNFRQILVKGDTLTKTNSEIINLYYPARVLAYGLYSNEVSLENQGDNLMYLLHLQNNSDGGWPIYNEAYRQGNINASVYGLWALCEFREKVKALK
jgi:hypothetical protein